MTTKNQSTVDAFESTLRVSYDWLKTFGEELGQTHAQLCYRCLRAGLHALRDMLPNNEALGLAAQLPMLIRGLYLEGWHLGGKPRVHGAEELYAGIGRELEGGMAAPPSDVTRALFATLTERLDGGEVRKLRQLLPQDIRALWPEPPNGRAHRAPAPRA